MSSSEQSCYYAQLSGTGRNGVQKLQTVEVAATEKPDGSVIWLHGLGADGHDFEAIVPEMNLPADLDLRFVFPHAPVRPVTLNGGMAMRAWYDIVSLDRDGPVDEEGIRQSAAILGSLVEQEHDRGVPYANIVVAGFSQGGAIASHFALRFSQRLAGLMALSTYLPLQGTLQAEVSDSDKAQPADLRIFMAHGTFDPVLPMQLGSASRDAAIALGYSVEWSEYPMAHAVCPQEIADISRWLGGCFAGDKR
jgi:phospholipase/carboxylesterase